MPAFVPSFENDLFISYASIDNDPVVHGDEGTKWVTNLKNTLEKYLIQGLGSRDLKIWMDTGDLRGNQDWKDKIETAIRSSAVLVCVASEAYLNSTVCGSERDAFLEESGEDPEGRLFVVLREGVGHNHEKWPETFFKRNGYPFVQAIGNSGEVTLLGDPVPHPMEEKEYFRRVKDVAKDIVTVLKRMKGGGDSAAAATASSAATVQVEAATENSAGENRELLAGTAELPGAIYLGATGFTLYDARESLKRFLEKDCGYRVLPEGPLSRSPAEFSGQVKERMETALAYVRLLGPEVGDGYEKKEAEIASELQMPPISWRSSDLERDGISDEQHRELVFGPEVVAMSLEDFKDHLLGAIKEILLKKRAAELARKRAEELAKQEAEESDSPTSPEAKRFVALRAGPGDLDLAEIIIKILDQEQVGYDVFDDDDESLESINEAWHPDGLIVLYGDAPSQWVRKRMKEYRALEIDASMRIPKCALYLDPPGEEKPLLTKPAELWKLSRDNKEVLDKYLENLTPAGNAA